MFPRLRTARLRLLGCARLPVKAVCDTGENLRRIESSVEDRQHRFGTVELAPIDERIRCEHVPAGFTHGEHAADLHAEPHAWIEGPDDAALFHRNGVVEPNPECAVRAPNLRFAVPGSFLEPNIARTCRWFDHRRGKSNAQIEP